MTHHTHPSHDTQQGPHLKRVRDKIAAHVLAFVRDRLAGGAKTFHAVELASHVLAQVPETSPDSPSRILRDLRTSGALGYRVLSRRQSLYEITFVRP